MVLSNQTVAKYKTVLATANSCSTVLNVMWKPFYLWRINWTTWLVIATFIDMCSILCPPLSGVFLCSVNTFYLHVCSILWTHDCLKQGSHFCSGACHSQNNLFKWYQERQFLLWYIWTVKQSVKRQTGVNPGHRVCEKIELVCVCVGLLSFTVFIRR